MIPKMESNPAVPNAVAAWSGVSPDCTRNGTSPRTSGHQYPFHPFFSTHSDGGVCLWQEGGDFIPGSVNDFGGSSATEFTHLISQIFPGPGNMPITRFENFNSGDLTNPCPAG